jgi:hypothetical protein
VNSYVFSPITLADINVRIQWINHLLPTSSLAIDGFNSISMLKVSTTISGKNDPMMSANFDYPLRVEIFFDSLTVLPLYNSDELLNIIDPYERKRITCIGD